ncbi:MAG: glutathione S-transferase family protein [Alphaproteobacteria bacterium]|jgi:glutathione S-transferase|nr:glutathione S-transferase [Rhodospirillaceae bacterium]MDP6404165.1 glutathione S-transferase family protein [Alphaproteobacteria bacterium]MDP6623270.1 glutathione S-transferase family protein [Alphaproteobacteria bacterium]|tara:strand:+ start:410 stop:1006 length:597 start_codon:yes stop_codon:yes gene_type:complete
MFKVYGDTRSGNCYKVKLALEILGRPYEWCFVDTLEGESRSRGFLAMNPNGRIPLLEIEPGVYLPESNAILWYLAEGSQYVPDEPLARARALQWMFFEQYSHEPYIATVRYWIHMLGQEEEHGAEIERRRGPGYAALDVMEGELSVREFFAGAFSVADIALYAYTHVAHEGGFDLDNYPAIRSWIQRIEAIPGYVPLA